MWTLFHNYFFVRVRTFHPPTERACVVADAVHTYAALPRLFNLSLNALHPPPPWRPGCLFSVFQPGYRQTKELESQSSSSFAPAPFQIRSLLQRDPRSVFHLASLVPLLPRGAECLSAPPVALTVHLLATIIFLILSCCWSALVGVNISFFFSFLPFYFLSPIFSFLSSVSLFYTYFPIPFLCFCVYSLIISSPPRLPYPLLSFDGLVRLSRRNQININLTCNANIAFDCRDWRLTTRPGITVDS